MQEKNIYLQWLTNRTKSIYWHDSARIAEQETAFQNGATGITTNPFLVNDTIRETTETWREQISVKQQIDQQSSARAEELNHCVATYFAQKIMPLYQGGAALTGFVCAQVNPRLHANDDAMLAEAMRIGAWSPNIVIKLPGTAAGLRVYEECVSKGFHVALTVGFSVSQVLQASLAAKCGQKRARESGVEPGRSIAVIMGGRLDDYLRDVALDSCAPVDESDIRLAGIACMKNAYRLLNERSSDTVLLSAGCRGTYHVTELSGGHIIMAISPKIYDMTASLHGPFEEQIEKPVPKKSLERLLCMPEFRKAYEPDGMRPENFITYGAVNRTLTQFIENGWAKMEQFSI